jgi:hypothetical protein
VKSVAVYTIVADFVIKTNEDAIKLQQDLDAAGK